MYECFIDVCECTINDISRGRKEVRWIIDPISINTGKTGSYRNFQLPAIFASAYNKVSSTLNIDAFFRVNGIMFTCEYNAGSDQFECVAVFKNDNEYIKWVFINA